MPDLAHRLADALAALRPDRPETIDALLPLYDDDVDFRDPIQHLRGLSNFLAMNRRLLGRARELTFTVHDALGDDDKVFLTWSMHAVPKLGPRIGVDGATHATARRGRVIAHRDYWDLGELMTSPIPAAHGILQFFLKPLA